MAFKMKGMSFGKGTGYKSPMTLKNGKTPAPPVAKEKQAPTSPGWPSPKEKPSAKKSKEPKKLPEDAKGLSPMTAKPVKFPSNDSDFWNYPLYIRGKEVSKAEYMKYFRDNPDHWHDQELWKQSDDEQILQFDDPELDKEDIVLKDKDPGKEVPKPKPKVDEKMEKEDSKAYYQTDESLKEDRRRDPADKGRWRRRKDMKKDLREHGFTRGKARQVALQSIPKRWGKHKGSF